MNQQVRFDPASTRRKVPATMQTPVTRSWRRNLPLGFAGGCVLMSVAAIAQSISFGIENLSWISLGTPFVLGLVATLLMLRLMQRSLGEQRRRLEQEFAERSADLLKTEKRFTEYGETSKEWFWETDTEDRIVFLSSRMHEVSGTRPEEVLGRKRESLRTEPLSEAERDMWADYRHRIENRLPYTDLRYTSKTADGKEIVYCSSGKPFFDDDGNFLGYRGTARDATGEVAEERRQRADQDLIYNATAVLSDGFYIFDADDRLMLCNPRFREIYADVADLLEPGVPYERILRAIAERQIVFTSDEERSDWIESTLADHANPVQELEEQLVTGEWIRVVKQRMDDGNVVGLCIDITPIKRIEEELAEAQRISSVGSYRMDFASGRLTSVSPQLGQIYGIDEESLLAADDPYLYDLLHPEDRERVRETYESAKFKRSSAAGDFLFEIEYRIRRGDGELRHVVERASASKIDRGRVTEVIGTLQDVTANRRIEEEFEAAQEIAHIGSFRWDVMRDRATSFSPEIARIYGRQLDEVLRLSDQEFAELIIHPEDRERVMEAYQRAIERGEGYSIEYRILRPDGSERHVIERAEVADRRDDKVLEFLGMFHDVTEQKFVERELEKAQEIAKVGSFRWDMEHDRMLSYSTEYLRIHGRSAEEMEALGLEGLIGRIIHPDDQQRVRDVFEHSETHDEAYQIEYRIQRPDGEYRHVVERCDTSVRRDGKPVEQVGTLHDITEFRQFEQELEDAQRLARIGSFRWDVVNQRLISGSREYLRILGRTLENPPGPDDEQFELTHPEDRERLLEVYRQSGETGEETEFEYRLQRRDGEVRYVSERLRTSAWVDGRPVEQMGIMQDITELKRAERELEDAQRLAQIGSFRWDVREKRLISCSREYLSILGQTRELMMALREDHFEQWVHEDDLARLLAAYDHIDETGEDLEIEYRILHPDGEVRNLIERIGVSAWLDGKPAEQLGTLQDVTERRLFEHELEEAQRIAGVGSFHYSLELGRYSSVSPELVRIYGRNEEELLTNDDAALIELTVHPDDRERVAACYAQADRTGEEFRIEYRLLRPDGEARRVIEHAEPLLPHDGKVVEQVGTMQDITERWLFEHQLEEAQRIAGVGSFHYSLQQGRHIFVSPELVRIYGRTAEDLLGFKDAVLLEQTVHPDDLDRVAACYAEHDASGEEYQVEFRLLRPDGEVRKVVEHAEPLVTHEGRVIEILGTLQDVTDQRIFEQELEEAQRLARTGSYRWDLVEDRMVSCTPELLRIFEVTRDQVLNRSVDELQGMDIHPEDRERVLAVYRSCAESRDVTEIEYRHIRPNGEIRYLVERLRTSSWRGETPIEQIGTVQDITESRYEEAQKRVADEMLEAAIENVPGGFLLVNPQGVIERFNRRFFDLYPSQQFFINEGVRFERFLQQGIEQGVYADALEDPEHWKQQRLDPTERDAVEFIDRLSDGRSIQVAVRRLPNNNVVGMHVDVTELERAREAAEQANAAKSDFLASMSHELRTPMHGILSFAELGIKRMETLSQEKLKQYLENIQISGNRLLFLLNDLLDLSKLEAGKMSLDLAPLNLVDLIQACINEQTLQLRESRLDCEFVSDESGARCHCDRNRIYQVVANVLSNAIKFSPEGERIEIRLAAIEDGFRIEVADQGIGIPEEELDQVFDRFYQSARSRNHSGGTGLGLAICREIIELHGGRIWAENNAGGGTRILFELPA